MTRATTVPWIFPFRQGEAEIPPEGAQLLGQKGANLAAMCRMGLPVPPGFTVSTALCRRYLDEGELPTEFNIALREAIADLEHATGKKFGAGRRTLLVSARSGAAVSMPGMMDTVLNLGLNEEAVEGLMRLSGNPRFAWDSYRRLIAMFGDVVCGIPRTAFDELLAEAKEKDGVVEDYELSAEGLRKVASRSLDLFVRRAGRPFPEDPYAQLQEAVEGVFRSWESPRAREYRRIHRLEGLAGTAVTIQAMVFGNSGGNSGTGVAFTRDPVTGEKRLYADFLFNAQGEDLVAGTRNPDTGDILERELPEVYAKLCEVRARVEEHFRDMQDVEFTVEDGQLFLLQTRPGKRSALAALRIAVDLVREGRISRAEALERLREVDPARLRGKRIAARDGVEPIAVAVPASAGVAAGRIALTSEGAVSLHEGGSPVILVREETSADDIAGMAVARGILTARGGRTSHAAVVARHMGVSCLVGCRDLRIDLGRRAIELGGRAIAEGEWLTLDGNAGRIYAGELAVEEEPEPAELAEVRSWLRAEGVKEHPLA